jgi:alkylated DNA repair dioxygenase AlkB
VYGQGPPPTGWRYEEEFLDSAQEESLVETLKGLKLEHARYKEWTARRRMVSYGYGYDFGLKRIEPADPIPPFLLGPRDLAARWAELDPADFVQASAAEYLPPAQLGWHRDVPAFDLILGISLLGAARMRFRSYPPQAGQRADFVAELQPRSVYLLSGPARWNWQHAISPTKELRYVLTFRSLRRTAT